MHRFAKYGAAISACLILSDAEASRASSQVAADLDAAPELRLVEELRVGSASDPNVGFSRIGNVAVDKEGQLYVFEAQDLEIRVYNSTGKLVRKIGRRGSGPGEFQRGAITGVKGDTVWAFEMNAPQSRISLFNRRDGALLSTSRTFGVRVPGRVDGHLQLSPAFMRADGKFISGGYVYVQIRGEVSAKLGPNDTIKLPRVLFSADGAVTDTVAWSFEPPAKAASPVQYVTTAGNAKHPVPRPASDTDLPALFVDGRFVVQRPLATSAAQGMLRVTKEGVRGESIYSRAYRYRPIRYSAEVLDELVLSELRSKTIMIVDGAIQQHAPDSSASTRAAVRQAMQFPDFQTPVQSVFVGADALIWLRREEMKSPTGRWDLLDTQGNPRGRINLPNNMRPAWSSGDTLWAVQPDADDVPWLVRFRISR